MTNYLISFPSGAMSRREEDLRAASEATRALLREAKAAGLWVFGAAVDEGVAPVTVDADGAVTAGTYPGREHLDGGFAVLRLPSREAALEWAARMARACGCPQELRVFHDDPES